MLQALGQIGSPPALLVGLLVLAAIVLVGRLVLNVAWKLLLVAIVVAAVLWILGAVGAGVGVLG